jgi:hypothetical protein
MRIWSLHPGYLDAKGLVALWRETLLAKHVLEGKTKGYKNHPQLERFKLLKNPVDGIDRYLAGVYEIALSRGYNFSEEKFNREAGQETIKVTDGQIRFEFDHLMKKLKERDPVKYRELSGIREVRPHPIFRVIMGEVESWEKIGSAIKKQTGR